MTWYRLSVNGYNVIAPLTPQDAAALGASPVAAPQDLTRRLARFVCQIADERRDAAHKESRT